MIFWSITKSWWLLLSSWNWRYDIQPNWGTTYILSLSGQYSVFVFCLLANQSSGMCSHRLVFFLSCLIVLMFFSLSGCKIDLRPFMPVLCLEGLAKLDIVQHCETQKVRLSHVRWVHTVSSVWVGEWSLGQWIVGVVSFQERYNLYTELRGVVKRSGLVGLCERWVSGQGVSI